MSLRLGILGGMGPLASAELLRNIYRLHLRAGASAREQDAPACVLYSDPSIPDRTEAILAGSVEELTARIRGALEALLGLGVERVVIACFTAHHVLPRLPEELRSRVVSLINLAVEELKAQPRPRLCLVTTGTYRAGIFQHHPRWAEVESWIRWPTEEDQEELHRRLYRLKLGEGRGELRAWIDGLRRRYDVEGLIFGCTELHLLSESLLAAGSAAELSGAILDPLWTVAQRAGAWSAVGRVLTPCGSDLTGGE